jgi:hypothetical protein
MRNLTHLVIPGGSELSVTRRNNESDSLTATMREWFPIPASLFGHGYPLDRSMLLQTSIFPIAQEAYIPNAQKATKEQFSISQMKSIMFHRKNICAYRKADFPKIGNPRNFNEPVII